MKQDLFMEKCTHHFRNAVSQAFHQAALQGTKVVTPLHLLFAIINETGSIGEEILRRAGVKREALIHLLGEGDVITLNRSTILSPNTKRAIEKAVARSANAGHSYVGTEHLLFGLFEIGSSDIEYLLQRSGVQKKHITQQLEVALKSASKLPELLDNFWGNTKTKSSGKGAAEKMVRQKMPALEYFGIELTNPELAEKIDPVIGRDAEIERVIHILARRTKNNPILLGDPGVGKTAIVEGLAKRIITGDVPPTLIGKKIFSVDLGLMVAGTMYRGEFEGRIKQLIDEVRAHPEIILFIDEVHSIVGAGSSNGTLDAANLLKPALARGELHVIGATTYEEFKKHIEHDAALERRFQPVAVSEPTAEETIEMLHHIKNRYELFHAIQVGDSAIEAAVNMAAKYFPEKHFPDKAIDLIDEAMSASKIQSAKPEDGRARQKVINAIKEMDAAKQQAILKEDFEEAQKIKIVEQRLHDELNNLIQNPKSDNRQPITARDIQTVISRILRRPISELAEKVDPTELSNFLQTKIIGQEKVINTVAQSIARAELGVQNENRPRASFLFVGSTGVGKTELAKLIATGIYHDPKAVIRIDLNEFSEGFSVSKLLGSPAGYVGYREGTTLIDRLRRQPMSVIIFDEVDKAHGDVINILLQMLEEGRITDSSGKEASVKQAIIILTYQVASEELSGSNFGFVSGQETRAVEEVRRSLSNVLRPELLNRIDSICVFQPLTLANLEKIATNELNIVRERYARRGLTLSWDENIPACIARQALDPKEGARRIRNLIGEQIEQPLITQITLPDQNQTTYHCVVQNDIMVGGETYERPRIICGAPEYRARAFGAISTRTRSRLPLTRRKATDTP